MLKISTVIYFDLIYIQYFIAIDRYAIKCSLKVAIIYATYGLLLLNYISLYFSMGKKFDYSPKRKSSYAIIFKSIIWIEAYQKW